MFENKTGSLFVNHCIFPMVLYALQNQRAELFSVMMTSTIHPFYLDQRSPETDVKVFSDKGKTIVLA